MQAVSSSPLVQYKDYAVVGDASRPFHAPFVSKLTQTPIGMLWAAQGSLMLSYPTESQKGLFIGIFWAIFNMGAVVGAVVSLSENFRSQVGTYVFPDIVHLSSIVYLLTSY